MKAVFTLKELSKFRQSHPLERIVLAGGIFDLFHAGHVKYLNFCKSQGDLLVVHVGSSKSSKIFKHQKTPVTPTMHRIEIVKNFRAVDLVFSDDSKHRDLKLVNALRPDVIMLSRESTSAVEIGELRKAMPMMEIVFNPRAYNGISTSEIIKKIKHRQAIPAKV